MGDFCMRFIAQIVSFFIWVIGTVTSILSKISPIVDDGISVIAGLIGIIGGIVWLAILRVKMRNEKLENKIKQKQLENLENIEI